MVAHALAHLFRGDCFFRDRRQFIAFEAKSEFHGTLHRGAIRRLDEEHAARRWGRRRRGGRGGSRRLCGRLAGGGSDPPHALTATTTASGIDCAIIRKRDFCIIDSPYGYFTIANLPFDHAARDGWAAAHARPRCARHHGIEVLMNHDRRTVSCRIVRLVPPS